MSGGGDKGAAEQAKSQERTSAKQIAESRRQFDQTRKDLKPVIDQLAPAVKLESALMGLSGAAAQKEALKNFAERADQKFVRERGEKALLRNAAAIGGLGGGNVRTELQQQGIGFASQRIGEALDRLAGIRTGSQATATGVGQLGANAVNAQNQFRQNAANAQAAAALSRPSGPSLGGVVSGAATGLSVGSAIPGIGSAAGAVIGGLAGLLG